MYESWTQVIMQKNNALPSPETSLLSNLIVKFRADFLTNWRLVLLGLTGIILSLASGWTTYDGIYNFTKTPVLSLMITFGIQGVMLVTAWLIGESFATGATGEGDKKKGLATVKDIFSKSLQLFLSALALLLISFILAKFALNYDTTEFIQNLSLSLVNSATVLGIILFVALFLVLFSKADIIGPYARGMRIILAHIPLWLMFLACMATSVFFSFDSLFSTIFTQEERKRAGDLRAQSQITGIISDIEVKIKQRQKEASQAILGSKDWSNYENELSKLNGILRSAPKVLQADFERKLTERQKELTDRQAVIANAQTRQRNLVTEQEQLKATLLRLDNQRPSLESNLQEIETQKRSKQQELATREAEARAEARGVGATGREGRGPKFRELNKFVTKLKIDIDAINSQLNTAQAALDENNRRTIGARNRLVEVENNIARFQTQEQAETEQLNARKEFSNPNSGLQIDISSGFKSLEKQVAGFREAPSREALDLIQQLCRRLSTTISQISQLKQQADGINCDPGKTNELGAPVFALNKGLARYQALCGKEAKVPDNTDALLDFGQRCVLTSALPSSDTQSYRNALNRIALNRDDKAHRFVVTWNAFTDRNALAYLALTIAIAIDSLVFMSGLFGAAAVVSPLADSPKARSRPVSQLKEIIDNALLPDKAYASDLVLNVMNPLHDDDKDGYMAKVNLKGLELEQSLLIKKVLAAGASLGLVKHDDEDSYVYLIRSELFEYVSSVRAYEAKLGNLNKESAIPKYRVPSLKPTDPIPLDGESISDIADKNIKIDFNAKKQLPAPELSTDLEFQSHEAQRREIFDTYLRAFGITETIMIRLEDMQLSKDSEEWERYLNHARKNNKELSHNIDNIQANNKRILQETYQQLQQMYYSNKELLFLVTDFATSFERLLPGITIWKAYQNSKKRAENVMVDFKNASSKIHSADEELQRKINDIVSQLEKAEQDKIDGWLELEENATQLNAALKKL